MNFPLQVTTVPTVDSTQPDDTLILAASWEERCLGIVRRIDNYRCRQVVICVYDGASPLRQKHIVELRERLARVAQIRTIDVKRADPIPSVRELVACVRPVGSAPAPRISLDVSTFTRKHLLQLLQGLDLDNLLGRVQFLYTEPEDYATQDDEPSGLGISSVKAIETFAGRNMPSRDSLLVLFLGYEGRRTLALWEHLEPHATVAVVPDPPFRDGWAGRTESQNRYLLSCLPKDRVLRSHSLAPHDTQALLERLVSSEVYSPEKYNYLVAPLGTKAQTLGLYRFWRQHRGLLTIMYARPLRYREHHATFPPGRSWVLDRSVEWR